MVNWIKREAAKPTPFLILGIGGTVFFFIVLVILMPDQTAGLGTFYALIIVLLCFLALLIDRMVVRSFKLHHVIYAELGFILFILLITFWTTRSTKIVVDTELDHFVVVYLEDGKTIDDFSYKFPFSRELRFHNPTCVVLDKSLENRNDINLEAIFPISDDGSMGYSIRKKLVYLKGKIRKVSIYFSGRMDAEDEAFLSCLDSL